MTCELFGALSYSPHTVKSAKGRTELEEWHRSVQGTPFNFRREAEFYCMQVVLIVQSRTRSMPPFSRTR